MANPLNPPNLYLHSLIHPTSVPAKVHMYKYNVMYMTELPMYKYNVIYMTELSMYK